MLKMYVYNFILIMFYDFLLIIQKERLDSFIIYQ